MNIIDELMPLDADQRHARVVKYIDDNKANFINLVNIIHICHQATRHTLLSYISYRVLIDRDHIECKHVDCKHMETIKLLIDNGADVNIHVNPEPLMSACFARDSIMIKLLLDSGANSADYEKYALTVIACYDNVDCAELIINHIDFNPNCKLDGIHIFTFMCFRGALNIAELLLFAGTTYDLNSIKTIPYIGQVLHIIDKYEAKQVSMQCTKAALDY